MIPERPFALVAAEREACHVPRMPKPARARASARKRVRSQRNDSRGEHARRDRSGKGRRRVAKGGDTDGNRARPQASVVGQGSKDQPKVVHAHLQVNPAGYAFATRLDGEGTVFIPPGNLAGAMDGDEVVVSSWAAERGSEGHVRSIVKRKRTRITGILQRAGKSWVVVPDDPRILGQAEVVDGPGEGRRGQVVLGTIVDYPQPWNERFTVQVERVLGEPGSIAAEQAKILIEHGIDPEFAPSVVKEVEGTPERVRAVDLENRADLRNLEFMTIDPKDARDFDDAVCIDPAEHSGEATRVHVAVADVSHYVREGTLVDGEASRRCFSTYLPDRAIPMLPGPLSSNICSLVPKEDRLAMVVTMDVDAHGKVEHADIRVAVIRSRARLTYEQVAEVLAGKAVLPSAVRTQVVALRAIADGLRKHRLRRGAIELQLPEAKVILDEDDPTRIRTIGSVRADEHVARAYNLIEEFMLAANEAVARVAMARRLPIVYRVHDVPAAEKAQRLASMADAIGVSVDPEQLRTPKGVQRFLAKIENHPKSEALNMLMLRSLAQAEYDTVNVGHFALASTGYVHFTSPIRRYPDLISHRVIKADLAKRGLPCGTFPAPELPHLRDIQAHAVRSSERERATTQAERDARALFAALYMRDRVGDRFEGMISGISPAGVFVTVREPYVDGLVRRSVLERSRNDTYEVDELGIRLIGVRRRHVLAMGDAVVVECVDANVSRRQIEFALVS